MPLLWGTAEIGFSPNVAKELYVLAAIGLRIAKASSNYSLPLSTVRRHNEGGGMSDILLGTEKTIQVGQGSMEGGGEW